MYTILITRSEEPKDITYLSGCELFVAIHVTYMWWGHGDRDRIFSRYNWTKSMYLAGVYVKRNDIL